MEPKFADYECFLTLKENLSDKKLLNFYTLIKNTKRKKIFVGPKKLKKVTRMLEIDNFVEVPIINAFSDYERVMNELVQIGVDKNNIYILCCSMMSCLICSDLKEMNKEITLLDIGSGLDPIFGERTRPKQPSEEECVKYFKNLLPKDHTFQKKKDCDQLEKVCRTRTKRLKDFPTCPWYNELRKARSVRAGSQRSRASPFDVRRHG